MRILWTLLLATLIASTAAVADEATPPNSVTGTSVPVSVPDLTGGTPFASSKVPPRTKPVIEKSSKSEVNKSLAFRSGAKYFMGVDNSGKGAVLCSRMIYVELRTVLENCHEAPRPPQDAAQAYFWLSLVPKADPNYAAAARLRKQMSAHLNDEQIAKFDREVMDWKPRPVSTDMTESEEAKKAALRFPEIAAILETQARAGEGDPKAQAELGSMYEHGLHVTQDFSRAETWYRKSATQGNAFAAYSLGRLYAEGGGEMSDDALKALLDEAINDIDDFIVANSPTPVTKDELDAELRSEILRGRGKSYRCLGSDARDMINRIKSSPAEFKASVKDLLSVPRPPVLNPAYKGRVERSVVFD